MPSLASAPPATTAAQLRFFNLISFPPALIILTVHGAIANRTLPALGIIPLFASAVLSAIILYRDKVLAVGSPIQLLSSSNIFLADMTIAVIEIILLFPTWATLENQHHGSYIVLGTYASVFIMVNFGIHLYFIAKRFRVVIQFGPPCDCEDCAAVHRQHHPVGQPEHTPLTADYDDLVDHHEDIESAPSVRD